MAVVNEKLGNYKQTTFYYEKVLKIGQKEQILEKEQIIVLLLNISFIFFEQNIFEEVERVAFQLIDMENYIGEDTRLRYIAILNNLGYVYVQQKNINMANQIYRRITDIIKDMPNLDDPDLLQLLGNISSFYVLIDQYEQALPFIAQALRIRLTFSNLEDPETKSLMREYSIIDEYIKKSKNHALKFKSRNTKHRKNSKRK